MSVVDIIDHTLTPDIVCPYCGHEFSDSWEIDPEDISSSGEIECRECDICFLYTRDVSVTYSTMKIELKEIKS